MCYATYMLAYPKCFKMNIYENMYMNLSQYASIDQRYPFTINYYYVLLEFVDMHLCNIVGLQCIVSCYNTNIQIYSLP